MFTIETIMYWLGMCYIVFEFIHFRKFPTLLPVAPTAFTPMQPIHEMIVHIWRVRWYTTGFL